jgi:hypothetical protein
VGGILPASVSAVTLEGQKKDDDGNLFANHFVFIRSLDGPFFDKIKTDGNGEYTLPDLAGGDYSVWTSPIDGKCPSTTFQNAILHDGFIFDITLPITNTAVTMDFIYKDCNVQVKWGDDVCDNLGQVSLSKKVVYDPNNWNDQNWPVLKDKVFHIPGGTTLTLTKKLDLGEGALCNDGTIKSADNVPSNSNFAANSFTDNEPSFLEKLSFSEFSFLNAHSNVEDSAKVEISAAVVQNNAGGTIRGADGVDGECGTSAGNGSSILVTARTFKNYGGVVVSGNGGESPKGAVNENAPQQPCRPPAKRCGEGQNTTGGDGGDTEIYAINFENWGSIETGTGGDAGAAHAEATGRNAGTLRVITPVTDDIQNTSENLGVFKAGHGGYICAPAERWQEKYGKPSELGLGGSIYINIKKIGDNSVIIGHAGSEFYYDPVKLELSGDVQVEGFDNVVLFTDEGGEIDLSQLGDDASISATKSIKIVTKPLDGEGGIVNLRGINKNIFKAGEKVEIFADEVQLAPETTIEDLAEAPIVAVKPGKILYSVSLMGDSQFFGEPGSELIVPVSVHNDGTVEDTFSFTVTDSLGWVLGNIANVTVEPREKTTVNLLVTLSNTRGVIDEIEITATSQGDSSVKTTLKLSVEVNAGDDLDGDGYPDSRDAFPKDGSEWLDSDGDGIGDNADPDDDNDGMPDEWENQYEGLSSVFDDALEDLDNDGYSNLDEYKANTNPEDPNSPKDLLVTLNSFAAVASDSRVELKWETASERDNVGFHLWRAAGEGWENGDYSTVIKLTDELIPADGNKIGSASYFYTDYDVKSGVTYYYGLEDIDDFGNSKFHWEFIDSATLGD